MSTKEFNLFQINEPDFSTIAYLAFLNRKLAEFGYFQDLISYKNILEEGKTALTAFYDSVDKRDIAFIQNTKHAIQANKPQAVVLITGGYHTPHLKQLFQKEGWSYAVLAPMVTQETNQQKYEKLFLEPLNKETKQIQTIQGETKSKPLSSLEKDLMLSKKSDEARMAMAFSRPVMERFLSAATNPALAARLSGISQSYQQELNQALQGATVLNPGGVEGVGARLAVKVLTTANVADSQRGASNHLSPWKNFVLSYRVALWKVSLRSGFSFRFPAILSLLWLNGWDCLGDYWLPEGEKLMGGNRVVESDQRLIRFGIQLHGLALELLVLVDRGLPESIKDELFSLLESSVNQYNRLALSKKMESGGGPGATMSVPLLLVRATSTLIRPDKDYVRLSRAMMKAPERYLKTIAILQLRAKQVHFNFEFGKQDIADLYASQEAIKFILKPENSEDSELKSALVGFLASVFRKWSWANLDGYRASYRDEYFAINPDDSEAMFDDFKRLMGEHLNQIAGWMGDETLRTGLEDIKVQFLTWLELLRVFKAHPENLESLLLHPQDSLNTKFFLEIPIYQKMRANDNFWSVTRALSIEESIKRDEYYKKALEKFKAIDVEEEIRSEDAAAAESRLADGSHHSTGSSRTAGVAGGARLAGLPVNAKIEKIHLERPGVLEGLVNLSRKVSEETGIVRFEEREFKIALSSDKNHLSRVCVLDGEIIGFKIVGKGTDGLKSDTEAYSYYTAVSKEWRGKGINQLFLRSLVEVMQEKKSRVRLLLRLRRIIQMQLSTIKKN